MEVQFLEQEIMHRILSIILSVIVLSACAQKDFNQTVNSYLNYSVDTISPKTLLNILDSVKLIDARSPDEFSTSKIKGAQFIDFDKPNFKNLSIAKEDTIVVYCTIGYRSEKIAEKLKKKGFKNVYNLYGGIIQWANDSNKICSPNGMTTNFVHTYDESWGKWLTNTNYQKVH